MGDQIVLFPTYNYTEICTVVGAGVTSCVGSSTPVFTTAMSYYSTTTSFTFTGPTSTGTTTSSSDLNVIWGLGLLFLVGMLSMMALWVLVFRLKR